MPRIRLDNTYRGWATAERVIAPGEYDLKDPALWGAGKYLVEQGLATVIDSETTPLEVQVEGAVEMEPVPDLTAVPVDLDSVDEAEVDTDSSLEDMTRDELDALAVSLGIDLDEIEGTGAGGNVVKSDVIAAIEVAR